MAPRALDVAVLALVTSRLTRLATADDLPVLTRARRAASDWLGHRLGLEWADGPYCPWCVSPYIGVLVTAGYAAARDRDAYILAVLPLALSAVAGHLAASEPA